MKDSEDISNICLKCMLFIQWFYNMNKNPQDSMFPKVKTPHIINCP